MKYLSQINAFWNWTRTNEISHLEADLYLSILDIANAAAWKPLFTIPNSTLGRFDKNSLVRARNKLVQYGLITYLKGKKGQAPMYSIVPLYDTKGDTESNTYNDTDNNAKTKPKQGTYIDKDKDKTREEYNTPKIPFDGILGTKVEEWLKYKKERGQTYRSTGLNSLFKKIRDNAEHFGENAVISAIDTSISNNWQGLFFKQTTSVQDTADGNPFLKMAQEEGLI